MAIQVKVPSVGESVTSGVLAAWHVKDGDYVKQDQVLFELETDKITAEGLAEADGRISLKAKEGDEVEIGQVVAEIDDTAGTPDNADSEEEAENADAGNRTEDQEVEEDKEKSSPEEKKPRTDETGQPEPSLSPAARRAAEESGVDPSRLKGSGKGGRITKSDVLAAAESSKKEKAAPGGEKSEDADTSPAAAASRKTNGKTTRKKLSTLRRRIAERLVDAQQNSAMLTTFNEVDLSAVKELRTHHRDAFEKKHGVKLGFMSFFVKAGVYALREVPEINVQLDGDTLIQNHFYDIAVAVATDRGLLVPVIRDCDEIGFAEIERRIADLAGRAQEGKIKLDELEGGVFTISNGGIYGSMLSTPILNPPQSAILGMHATMDRPVAIDGEIRIRPMMYLALSYDHRVVDGREAVTFLRKIKEALEEPARILLEI